MKLFLCSRVLRFSVIRTEIPFYAFRCLLIDDDAETFFECILARKSFPHIDRQPYSGMCTLSNKQARLGGALSVGRFL